MVDDAYKIMWKQLLTASAAMQIALAGGPSQLPGWPIVYADVYEGERLFAVVRGAPVVGDIDRDGYLEVVATGWVSLPPTYGGVGWIGVYRHDGTPYPGWPKIIPLFGSIIGPALGDVDGDQETEVVASNEGTVFVWDRGGELKPGWPRSYAGLPTGDLALTDLDGDGQLDIVLSSRVYNYGPLTSGKRVHAWNGSGQVLPGWHVTLAYPTESGGPHPARVVVGDLDGDESKEVVVPLNASSNVDCAIAVLSDTGNLLNQWSVPGSRALWDPVLGDLDGDGRDEIVAPATSEDGAGDYLGQVWVYHGDGTVVDGWPRTSFRSPKHVALADFDGDEKLEIVYATESHYSFGGIPYPDHVVLVDLAGNPLPGWPVDLPPGAGIRQGLVIGDIDGDTDLEILGVHEEGPFGGQSHVLYAWHDDGTVVSGFPILLNPWDTTDAVGCPAIVDLDLDGTVDIVVPQDWRTVNAFDLTRPYRQDTMHWPMYRQNQQRTGTYAAPAAPAGPPWSNASGTSTR